MPATMAAVSAGLAEQDRPLKAFDRLYAVYQRAPAGGGRDGRGRRRVPVRGQHRRRAGRPRRDSACCPASGRSRGSSTPDRWRWASTACARASARFRNEQDLHLLLDPVAVLSPVFTADLATAELAGARWLTLFFDTYERTGPVLDGWLRELFIDGRYGALPANVVVTLAGQASLDRARLGRPPALALGHTAAARPLQRGGGAAAARCQGAVTDEAVIDVVLRLTHRLPLLVSTLAAARPREAEAARRPRGHRRRTLPGVGTGSRGPRRRSCRGAPAGLPANEDVYRVAVADDVPAAADLPLRLAAARLALRGRNPATLHYHDSSSARCSRLYRTRSRSARRDRHERLAAAYGTWRERAARGRSGELRVDEEWRERRLLESYHQLCADPVAALPDTLLYFARACAAGAGCGPCASIRMLADAAADADAAELADWAWSLGALYDDPAPHGAPAAPLPEPQTALPAARRGGSGTVPPEA